MGLPLLYLLIFDTVFGDQVGHLAGQPGILKASIVITPSIIVIGVVSAAFQNLAISLVQDRENGVLKRLRSAPVPTWLFLGGQLVNALLTALVMAVRRRRGGLRRSTASRCPASGPPRRW